MEKISWNDKKTKEEILHIVQEDRKTLNTIGYCKHKWMSKVLWHAEIVRDVIRAKVNYGNRQHCCKLGVPTPNLLFL